jgi:transposase-like protein
MGTRVFKIRPSIRYSEAFKLELVRELESSGEPFERVRRKYGLGVSTLQDWVRKYGNGTRGKIIRVEKPEEIDEKQQLRQRVRQLEKLLATANIDLSLSEAYLEMACERAGIKDVEDFKKKVAGQGSTKPAKQQRNGSA